MALDLKNYEWIPRAMQALNQSASIPPVENPTPIGNLQDAVSQNPPNQNFQQNFSL